MTKHYTTANAFRTALEERLKNHSRKTGMELQRIRRQVAFDRLLSRLFRFFTKDLLLKGGYAMELRLFGARATKDIDLVLNANRVGTKDGQAQVIRQMLQDAVQEDSGDFFEFLVGEPTRDLTLLTGAVGLKIDILKIAWEPKFNQMAKECGLDCDIKQAFERVESFISKVPR